MPRSGASVEDVLVHVVVCGGTPDEWAAMSASDWQQRFTVISRGVSEVGARWVTVLPHHGDERDTGEVSRALQASAGVACLEVHGTVRHVWNGGPDLAVVVDQSPDGHARFAGVVEALRQDGRSIDEDSLSSALSAPVDVQADLVLILGPPDQLPTSLVWELAYSELVFLDISWTDLQAVHLEMAIDDFNRRHRRFGGLDS